MKRIVLWLVTCCVAFVVGVQAADKKILRVGVAPTSPPIQYWEENRLSGLEADFAAKLGEELGRKVQFEDLPFRRLIPALLAHEIDIIMSGMSITKVRSLQVTFADPYMKIGQMPLVRLEDQNKFAAPSDVVMTSVAVGATENTTSEFLLVQEFPNAKKTLFKSQDAGVSALKKKKIDMLVLDSPYILWLAKQSDGKLAAVPILLTEENLAWAVHRDEPELLQSVNAILAKWKQSGQLDEMIKKRVPDFR